MTALKQALSVGVVVPEFPAVSETFVLDHINGLIDRGHRVCVLRRTAPADTFSQPDLGGQHLAPLISTWISPGGRLKRSMLKLAALPRVPLTAVAETLLGPFRADLIPLSASIRGQAPALLHAHFARQGEMLARLKKYRLITQPFLVTVHGFDINRVLAGSLPGYAHLFDYVDQVIVGSAFMRRQTERLGCPSDKISLIPQGIHLEQFHFAARHWAPATPLKLLSVARLVGQKGIAHGIRAVAELIHSGIAARYTIVGDGPLRQQLGQLARDCGIADSVSFVGAQPRSIVQQHYADNHLFLFPCTKVAAGDEEGQGIALLEAQACGLPILATRHGGIPESVNDGRSAVVVADDVGAVVKGLQDLVSNPLAWTDMGLAGRAHVERNFQHKMHIARIEETYRAVLARSGLAKDSAGHACG